MRLPISIDIMRSGLVPLELILMVLLLVIFVFYRTAPRWLLTTKPIHRFGGVLDLFLTDVPALWSVSVSTPIGRIVHSHLRINFMITSTLPDFDVGCIMHSSAKSQVNWSAVRKKVTELLWQSVFYSR